MITATSTHTLRREPTNYVATKSACPIRHSVALAMRQENSLTWWEWHSLWITRQKKPDEQGQLSETFGLDKSNSTAA